MSVNFNRAEKHKCSTSKEYKALYHTDHYWDEGIHYYYPEYHYWAKRPKKRLLWYQVRMYKTWKYNRETQYKIG